MARPAFNPDELKPSGKFYPQMPPMMGMTFPPDPVLHRPISARENFKLLFSGKKPYWIPVAGWANCDVNQFRPRINADNVANHQVFDGGPVFDYAPQGDRAKGWFDMEWVWGSAIGGATTSPGKPMIPDITRWEEYIKFPVLDKLDWAACAAQNVDYLGSDKLNELGIQVGFWERLMDLMDVAEASIALVDDESKPAVHRFFDQLADFFCDYISRIKKICDINAVVIHSDWAHARAPFLSNATLEEMILPYLKRVIDHAHGLGLFYEIHCCGACELLVPFFIKTGANMWCGQTDLNDIGSYAKKYRDSNFVFGVPGPTPGPETPLEEVRAAARAWVEEYKDCHVALVNMAPSPVHPKLVPAIYEFSRKAYEKEN